ncbi:ribosomal protection-like ABC-F family protein [Alkalibacterium thalassium]|uniref:Macrolide transport system ATP-binding/permease protein n=1 Tax=Alkalibacterium thalassium TaxID=426701 RepID=A0A1G9D9U4_9LACT|nr:ABC-F family ATP-binding cassette domain-containing protein [Alkalibacterium thalassium]SDK60659.1 macrolide transport system ATP-binding/permease protein [Alkalibacterium thalassium]
MPIVSLNHLSKSYGDRLLFDIAHLQIESHDRIGLVGANGSGKSTLFRLIKGLEEADSGSIERHGSIELLPQLKETNTVKSGGETTADYIIQALNKQPKLLLADEPTTHLDISHIEWVEKSFRRFTGAFLVVSHDRAFLDKVCTSIWELEDQKLTVYKGNYSDYKEAKARELKNQQTEYEKYISKRNQLIEARDNKVKQAVNATKSKKKVGDAEYNLKGSAPYFQKKSKKLHQVQKSMDTRIDKLEKVEKPKEQAAIRIEVPDMDKLNRRFIVRMTDCVGKVPGKTLWNKATLSIKGGDKVALVGPNGSGKTTLINMLLNGDSSIQRSPSLKIGYFSQNLSTLDTSLSILDNVKQDAVQSETLIRIILAQLLFKGDDVYKPISVLSGGERVKVSLAKLIAGNYNTLVLDEPTNFLDIQAVEALESLLQDYEGSVLFVSHDRSFINAVASKVWVIEDQQIHAFDGNLNQWEESKEQKEQVSTDEEELLRIENRIAEVLGALSLEYSEEKDEEFNELIRRKRELLSE